MKSTFRKVYKTGRTLNLMDQDFENFMITKGLSASTQKQYSLYYDKVEVLYSNGLLDQGRVNEFIANYKSSLVKSFLRLYFDYKGIKDLILYKRSGKVARKKPNIMSREDANTLFEVLYNYNEKIALMVELSYSCALRRDEVCNINAGDIDWDRWKKEKDVGKLLISHAKGGKQRYVFVPKELMIKLKDYVNKISVCSTEKLFFKNENNKDIPITKERYWEIYHDVVTALFGKKYKLHTLRFSKATHWFEEGVDIVRIQNRLGHSDISTTRLYINPDEKSEERKWEEELKEQSKQ